jgi:hydrogenase maturation factor
MCRTAIGQVISVEDGEAIVDLDGLSRRALALMVPDLRPGDLVLVGLGTVLGRVEPEDRAALDRIQPSTSRPSMSPSDLSTP